MDFEAKIQKNRGTKASKNDVFVDCIFQRLLEGFWEALGRLLGGFWEGVGGSWRLLGHFLAFFLGLVFRMLSKRALGGFWVPFWLHFGRV